MSDGYLAGRELDAAIAERVMGWEVFDLGYYGTEEETPRMRELCEWVNKVGINAVGRYAIDVGTDHWLEMSTGFGSWRPSTDIAAAMQVVEKMREYDFRLVNSKAYPPAEPWVARFENFITGEKTWAPGATAPLAICRAALVALREKPKDGGN